jgi:hypothetical protein
MANNTNTYSDAEIEISALKAALESINSMVKYEMLSLSHNDPASEICFSSYKHQQFFSIILLYFQASKIFGTSKKCMEGLQTISISPQHGTNTNPLKMPPKNFSNG